MTFTALMEEADRRNPAHIAYYAALELVTGIEQDLTSGRRHYRAKSGELLTTLEEVVAAIINRQLAGVE